MADGDYIGGKGSVAPEGLVVEAATFEAAALRPLPMTVEQALRQAHGYVDRGLATEPGMCDHYVGLYYGLSHSGFATARAHWEAMPATFKHGTGPMKAGALCLWSNGVGEGHAAIAVDATHIASTDIITTGRVSIVPVTLIAQRWGLTFKGWCDPWYGSQGVDLLTPPVIQPSSPPPPAPRPVPVPVVPVSEDVMRFTLFVKQSESTQAAAPAWLDVGVGRRHVSQDQAAGWDKTAGGPGKGHGYAVLPDSDEFWALPVFPAAVLAGHDVY